MDASLFDVLHDAADDHFFAIGQGIDVALDGVVQEAVEQHRGIVGNLDRFAHVTLEVLLLMDDFHGAATQHVGRTDDQRIADFGRQTQGVLFSAGGAVGRLLQAEIVQQLLEALAVLGDIDRFRRRADDGHAVGFQRQRQLERVWPPY